MGSHYDYSTTVRTNDGRLTKVLPWTLEEEHDFNVGLYTIYIKGFPINDLLAHNLIPLYQLKEGIIRTFTIDFSGSICISWQTSQANLETCLVVLADLFVTQD